MSAQGQTGPTTQNEVVATALRATGLLGCGCCVDSEDYDIDGCPLAEGGDWTDHTFEGECIHNLGRAVYLARADLCCHACIVARAYLASPADGSAGGQHG